MSAVRLIEAYRALERVQLQRDKQCNSAGTKFVVRLREVWLYLRLARPLHRQHVRYRFLSVAKRLCAAEQNNVTVSLRARFFEARLG